MALLHILQGLSFTAEAGREAGRSLSSHFACLPLQLHFLSLTHCSLAPHLSLLAVPLTCQVASCLCASAHVLPSPPPACPPRLSAIGLAQMSLPKKSFPDALCSRLNQRWTLSSLSPWPSSNRTHLTSLSFRCYSPRQAQSLMYSRGS